MPSIRVDPSTYGTHRLPDYCTSGACCETVLFNPMTGRFLPPGFGFDVSFTPTAPTRPEIGTDGRVVLPIHGSLEALGTIEGLAKDWDSYGSEAPNHDAVAAARQLIWDVYESSMNAGRKPAIPYSVVPLSGGGVQVEWRGNASAIEVEIASEGTFGYLLKRGIGPSREFEEEDAVSRERIVQLVALVI